ncbi:MAG TPA: glycosyltransferase family 2 protein [Terriglobales bacterium]|nr:glycosyltransferase family 2 protein [Terriglobales bacterium]
MSKRLKYVIITPARNEAEFIELTLKSVSNQTVLPSKWVIVSDGSTDGTDQIVKKYMVQHPWIELVRMPERSERHFAGKVHAFNAGYVKLRDTEYDVIVSLDGDISFDDDYFEFLLERLSADEDLGLAGTPFRELSGETYDYRFVNIEHVSGACQVFARECFEAIGGYMPVKGGSIDHIAVITARMKGWKTRTFTEKSCLHHRTMGTAGRGLLKSRFKLGMKDYSIGNHPVWELFRTARQMILLPKLAGGLALAAGYLWGVIRQVPRPVSPELMAFHRREQMQRLSRFISHNHRVVDDAVKSPFTPGVR